jgi:hypothetical protein
MGNASSSNGRWSAKSVGAMGFRRVDHVRVIVGAGRPFAELTGVTRRYPCTIRVSLATANRLARAGVPLRLEHRRQPAAPEWAV